MQVGNFIGDFVKGSKFNNYPEKIKDGILFHRMIDEFTDSHPVVIEFVQFLKPTFGRYSAIITDMYFDYFLAKNFKNYSPVPLRIFALKFYCYALLNYRYLPKRVKGFIFHFIFSNRLTEYRKLEGLKNSLEIMSNYKVKALKPDIIIHFLQQHQTVLENMFVEFFKDLLSFCHKAPIKTKK